MDFKVKIMKNAHANVKMLRFRNVGSANHIQKTPFAQELSESVIITTILLYFYCTFFFF